MPHVIVEYTGNLGDGARIPELLQAMNETLMAQNDVFPAGGIRSRAIKLAEYRMTDDREDDAFAHVTFKVAKGRTPEVKKAACDVLFGAIKAHFAQAFTHRYLALSIELIEFGEGGNYEHDNIHACFRKTWRMLDTTIIQTVAYRLHQTEIDCRQIRQVLLDRSDIAIENAYVTRRG